MLKFCCYPKTLDPKPSSKRQKVFKGEDQELMLNMDLGLVF
jgi:hypothetical protein